MGYLKTEFEGLMSMNPTVAGWNENKKGFAFRFFMTGAACAFYKLMNEVEKADDESGEALLKDFVGDISAFKQECLNSALSVLDPKEAAELLAELTKEE